MSNIIGLANGIALPVILKACTVFQHSFCITSLFNQFCIDDNFYKKVSVNNATGLGHFHTHTIFFLQFSSKIQEAPAVVRSHCEDPIIFITCIFCI